MSYRHQPCGSYNAADEDIYRTCPDCPAAIRKGDEHTADDCAREQAITAQRQADDDRDMPRGYPD